MEFGLDVWLVLEVAGLGLIAGTLGGMLGVGGSTIIIPGLTLIIGYNQHLYQAAAMVANVAVSVPAARRHYRAGATTMPVLRWMVLMALIFVVVGVWLSNLQLFRGVAGGLWLGRLLAVFLVYVVVVNVQRLRARHRQDMAVAQRPGRDDADRRFGVSQDDSIAPAGGSGLRGPGALVGAVMGIIAGLLGIGGGAIAVPMQQVVLKLPLRSCIANSSAVICLSATLGAVYKNASLAEHGYHWHQSVTLALLLAPTCWLGGHLGAGLTHRLPVRQVRGAFVCLMIVAAIKMAAIF